MLRDNNKRLSEVTWKRQRDGEKLNLASPITEELFVPERAGKECAVTRANIPKASETCSFLKFSMRAIADAYECD